jgi:predicted membrane-bound spermidine synthase
MLMGSTVSKRQVFKKIHLPAPLQVIAFLTGFALMTFELVAARILAPSIGSSTYVWTSVIGIIIAALSVGYWYGGKLADKRDRSSDVALLCIVSAVGVAVATLIYPALLDWIVASFQDNRVQGVVASVTLFAPTSFVLGMISPYLVKLSIHSLSTSGRSVAGLSALNSVGGIIGTFVTGFILFSYIGSRETLLIVVVSLLISSWLLVPHRRFGRRLAVSFVILAVMLLPAPQVGVVIAQIDTPSAHYTVADRMYNGQLTRGLMTGPNGIQSAITKSDPSKLAFWYTSYAASLIEAIKPQKVLVLGGGVFTLPAYLADTLPDAQIDAVEIDPALYDIAKAYFDYRDRDNLALFFEDARTFVNQSSAKYDVIVVDVYGDTATPFTFLTKEYGAAINDILSPEGSVIVNAIGAQSGPCRDVIDVIDAAYRPHAPYAYWQTQASQLEVRANYILVYSKEPFSGVAMNTLEPGGIPAYTDNFAPAEQLTFTCLREAYR